MSTSDAYVHARHGVPDAKSPKYLVTSLRVGTDWADTEEDALVLARAHLDVGASRVAVLSGGVVYGLHRDADGKEVRS